jgi:site-specific DNA recombinase
VKNGIDDEVYKEEYIRVSAELEELRKRRVEYDRQDSIKEGLRRRVNEIIETINSRQELLEEFDENIFNALVEKIEVISPAHFIFVLKSGIRIEEFKE